MADPKNPTTPEKEAGIIVSAVETASETVAIPANGAPKVVVQASGDVVIPTGAKVLDMGNPAVREATAKTLEANGFAEAAQAVRGGKQELKFVGKMAKVGDKSLKLRHVAYFAGGVLVVVLIAEVAGRYSAKVPCFGIFKKRNPLAVAGKK
jgi:hypothetical protein